MMHGMPCPSADQIQQLAGHSIAAEVRAELLDHAATCIECHAALAVLASAPTATATSAVPFAATGQLGRYRIECELGRGAMGVVYAAHDPDLDRRVAIKLLHPLASAARLRREAQVLAKLAHPHVVRVYDVGEHDSHTFVAMELVDGDSLRVWLKQPRELPTIIDVLVQAGRGLAAAHAAGIVHRDFKPDNVLVTRSGQAMVGDFGLARTADTDAKPLEGTPTVTAKGSERSLTATGAVVGTPAYMAPEQAGGVVNSAVDQYAFCVTAWEACFGRRPELSAPMLPVRRPDDPAVPRAVEAALRRGLSMDPRVRFPSMEALLDALAPPRRMRRWPWLIGGSIAVAAATGIAVAVTARSEVNCEAAAETLAEVWNDSVRDRTSLAVAETGPIDRYAARWKARRVEACRATHVRSEQTVATLESQVACLDRARSSLGDMLKLIASEPGRRSQLASLVAELPSVERCTGPLPRERPRTAADDALANELLVLAANLAAFNPNLTLSGASDLRTRVEAQGEPTLVLRALILEARAAAWAGDVAHAETTLRTAMLRAEAARDDFGRAEAMATLALVIVSLRTDEAAALLSTARGALARAGIDPAVEQVILEGEAALAAVRGNYAAAANAQARAVAVVESRLGDSSALVTALARLEQLRTLALDSAGAASTRARLIEVGRRLGDHQFTDDVLSQSVTPLLVAGNFEGGQALARRQLSVVRATPKHSLYQEADILESIALMCELAGEAHLALESYREALAIWRRPADELRVDGQPADLMQITQRQANALLGIGTALTALDRAAEAVPVLREALALTKAAADRPFVLRRLGVALVATRSYREARDVLEQVEAAWAGAAAQNMPMARAQIRFALAQALWADGGARDRDRARALATDAERDLDATVALAKQHPRMRRMPSLVAVERQRIASWRDVIGR